MHLATQSKASVNGSFSLCLVQLLGSLQQSREEQAFPRRVKSWGRGVQGGQQCYKRNVLFALAEGGQDLSCSGRSGLNCVYFLALLFSWQDKEALGLRQSCEAWRLQPWSEERQGVVGALDSGFSQPRLLQQLPRSSCRLWACLSVSLIGKGKAKERSLYLVEQLKCMGYLGRWGTNEKSKVFN